ncbi:MAG TPA: hypothetical protein VEX64_06025 [Pyrinomonadaceae bacterium]|nr:hypothetical protein [Pyrinomonadaceae bacterium]
MKKCPVCNRTYTDESLNFCLEDGAALVAAAGQSGFSSQPSSGFGSQSQSQNPQSWQPNMPQNPTAPKPKKSRTGLWILGILGIVLVVGVVGIFGLLILIGLAVGNENENENKAPNNSVDSNTGNRVKSNRTASNANLTKPATGKIRFDGNLGSWGKINSEFGRAEETGGEYQVSSKKSDNYYVIISPPDSGETYITNNATTKMTVRSLTETSPYLGYGLIVHSDESPLESDFAFVIRTDENPSFRVAKHEDSEEIELVEWTAASQIRGGTAPNELEVRSDGKQLQFYINGQFATSVADTKIGKGVVGIYTSGTPTVGFSNLKIVEN